MNQNELVERLLLVHPDTINYYRQKYEIYNLLELSFDLFFSEDIINYNDDFYFYYNSYKNENLIFLCENPIILYDGVSFTEISHINSNDILIMKNKIYVFDIQHYNMASNKLFYLLGSIVSKIEFSQKQRDLIKYIDRVYDDNPNLTLNEIIYLYNMDYLK